MSRTDLQYEHNNSTLASCLPLLGRSSYLEGQDAADEEEHDEDEAHVHVHDLLLVGEVARLQRREWTHYKHYRENTERETPLIPKKSKT